MLCLVSSVALADSDPWGNEYPAACTREAAADAVAELQVIEVRSLPITKGTASRCGYFDDRFDPPLIYVLKSCSYPRAEVLRHEGCHAIAGEWHD